MMIHESSTESKGPIKKFLDAINVLNKVNGVLVDIYHRRTGIVKDKLIDMIAAETWMTAKEALKHGFVDKITNGGPSLKVSNEGDIFIGDELLVYNSIDFDSEKLKEKILSIEHTEKNIVEGGKGVKFADLFAKLDAAEQAVVTQHISSQIDSAVEKANKPLNDELTAVKAEIEVLQTQIQATQPTQVPIDPTAEAINGLPADVQAILEEQASRLKALETEKAVRVFKDQLVIFDSLPIEDKHVEALYVLSCDHPEHYKALENVLKVANEAMKAGFQSVGTANGKPTAADAFSEIQSLVTAKQLAVEGLEYNEAFRQVVAENPALYERYRDERPVHPMD